MGAEGLMILIWGRFGAGDMRKSPVISAIFLPESSGSCLSSYAVSGRCLTLTMARSVCCVRGA